MKKIGSIIIILSLVLVMLLTGCDEELKAEAKKVAKSYNTLVNEYNENIKPYNEAVDSISSANDKFNAVIDEAQKVLNKGEEPFDAKTKTNLKKKIVSANKAVVSVPEKISEKKTAPQNMPPFDFIFIDAGKSHYRDFFDRAELLAAPGALIVCDNILMHGWTVDRSYEGAKRHRTNVKYMRQFIEYISKRKDLTVSLLSSGDGLAVIRLHE